jgi:type IV pilus assembly protein PilO
MPVLAQTRRRFRAIALVLVAVSVLAAAYIVFPIGPNEGALRAEIDSKHQEALRMEKEVTPFRNLSALLAKSDADRKAFYQERLPARFSQVSEQLGALAAKSAVRLEDVKYETIEVQDAPDLQAVQVDATLSGGYSSLAKFINAVERNRVFFLLGGLTLEDEQSGNVRLSLKLETYLRPRTPEDFKREDEKAKSKSGKGQIAD